MDPSCPTGKKFVCLLSARETVVPSDATAPMPIPRSCTFPNPTLSSLTTGWIALQVRVGLSGLPHLTTARPVPRVEYSFSLGPGRPILVPSPAPATILCSLARHRVSTRPSAMH
jgi:hypothetical protein